MDARERACLALTILCALFVGDVALHSTEVTADLALLGVLGAVLGFASARLFWLWSALLGAAVPLAYTFASVAAIVPRGWPEPPGALTYAAIAAVATGTALVAGAAGAALARGTPATPSAGGG